MKVSIFALVQATIPSSQKGIVQKSKQALHWLSQTLNAQSCTYITLGQSSSVTQGCVKQPLVKSAISSIALISWGM